MVGMKRTIITAAIAFICLSCSVAPAQAKQLIFKSGSLDSPAEAYVIRHPTEATTFFGRLQSKDDVDYFSVTAEKGTALDISLDTVRNDGEFNPVLIFFGPDLSKPAEDPVIDLGSENGAIIGRVNVDDRTYYRDTYILTDFYSGPSIKIKLPKTATYGLAIRSPNGKLGRYRLDVHGEDKLALSDYPDYIFNLIKAIFRIY